MTRDAALQILDKWVTKDFSRKHMLAVEACMRAYAKKFGEDEDKWSLAGLLHDADWDTFPAVHPLEIVKLLRESGDVEVADAISAHGNNHESYYLQDGSPRFTERKTLLDHALYACDEITGFIMAVSYVRPDGLATLEAKSVIKKLKDKSFAAQVNREEIYDGPGKLGVPFEEHVAFILDVMEGMAEVLKK